MDTQAKPLYFKACSVPFTLKQKVEQELQRLESRDIITPVPFSQWTTHIVPVVKNDGTVRACSDYKLTTNRVSKIDMYPLPEIEELFASLSGCQTFSKLDLSHAYLQVPLAEESHKYIVINTHKGYTPTKDYPLELHLLLLYFSALWTIYCRVYM